MAEADQNPIERLTFFDKAELVGARWWQPSVVDEGGEGSSGRRKALMILGAVVALPIGIAVVANLADDDSAIDQIRPSTDLQRESGWDVGSAGRALDWTGAQATDVDGQTTWRSHVKSLAADLAPPAPLLPWALPTLLQMPSLPLNGSLANGLQPILSAPSMPDAWQVGRALVGQLGVVPGTHRDILLVIDLPGPQSVAVAAALCDAMAPVFVLDNCPHPAGVVPAHRTLGAALYLLPRFLAGRTSRPESAPPAIVLDSARLSPYSDAPDKFDNRYLARMPSPAQLRQVGVAHVLYLGAGADVLDDLVEPFDSWVKAGIDVRMLQLGDFSSTASAGGEPDFGPGRRAWYGGSAESDPGFWYSYGWYQPTVPRPIGWVARPSGAWRFRARPTLFAGSVGRVHSAQWGGRSFGSSSSRSGSWTRTGGSSFG
ncbi:MAG: hypothetical protein HY902_18505 [Deltaproteobacteria bacterium]|nr:hypothetical protein [Deltaproteobacteria bacterium]